MPDTRCITGVLDSSLAGSHLGCGQFMPRSTLVPSGLVSECSIMSLCK